MYNTKHTLRDIWRDVDGIIRWYSNNAVVPMDVMKSSYAQLIADGYDMAKHKQVLDEEIDRILQEYRNGQRDVRSIEPEEMYEMRSAFGEGATVVDVISGRTTVL